MTLVVAGLALGVSAVGLWRRQRSRGKLPRRRLRLPKVELAELKALAQKRQDDMQGCRLSICQQAQVEDGWLRLLLKVEPPSPQSQWWPWGISLECPDSLARRDAMREGGVMQWALPKRVEGHDLDSYLHGTHTIAVLVLLPSQCSRLEVGYYGRPIVFWEAFSTVSGLSPKVSP